jgi:hypothetical protein
MAYGIPNWFENWFLDHVNYSVLDGIMTVILWRSDKPLQTVIKVASFWAMLTAYHSMALVLHSCPVQNTEKGMSIKVENSQIYVYMKTEQDSSVRYWNESRHKERNDKKLEFFFSADSVSNSS